MYSKCSNHRNTQQSKLVCLSTGGRTNTMYTKKTNKLLQWLHRGTDFSTAFAEKLDFYLHHEHDGVEGDHRHDGVFKWRRHHKLPHSVLKAQLVLGHVTCQGSGVDGEVYTSSLQNHNHGVCSLVCAFHQHPTPLHTPPTLTSFFSKL